MDRSRALEVLRAYQLPEPTDLLLPWLRLAVASGAGVIRLSRLPWGLRLSFDGAPLPPERLHSPLDCLFGEEAAGVSSRYPHLLAGLLAALRFSPWRLSLASGAPGGRVRLAVEPDGAERFGPDDSPGAETVLSVTWRGWFTRGLTARCLRRAESSATLLPAALLIDGCAAVLRPAGGHAFSAGGISGRIAFPPGLAESSIRLHTLGVAAARVSYPWDGPGFLADVNDDGMRLSACQSAALKDDRYRRVLQVVGERARALSSVARPAPSARIRLSP